MKNLFAAILLFFYTYCHSFQATDEHKANLSDIGEMIMIGFRGVNSDDNWTIRVASEIENKTIGGVVFYAYNIENKTQFKNLTNYFISKSKTVLLSIDEEGGKVQRLAPSKGFTGYQTAQYIAQNSSEQEAYNEYLSMAKQLKEYNINYNFAPVVDLSINKESPIIAQLGRSYSDNPQTVANYAEQLIIAHNKAGVLTSLKHFPGHGSAAGDTHKGLTDATAVWQEKELEPYKLLINQNLANSIMVSHIVNQNIDTKPASLSKKTIDILRNNLNYDGVVISDDLQMGAIANEYDLKFVVVEAINAGNDILLFSNYFNPRPELATDVKNIIIQAINDGTISKENVLKSIQRIKKMKQTIGLY